MESDLEFLKTIGIKNTKVINELYKKVHEKSSDIPGFKSPIVPGITHQCDLIEMPSDHGYTYILSVVDVGNKMIDCEKLKIKTSDSTLKAIKKIYKRGIIKQPEYMLTTDLGNEFKGEFQKYFEDLGVIIKKADPGRHRQTGLVEAKNKRIGKLLFLRQTNEELESGKENRKWIDILSQVVTFLNKKQAWKNKNIIKNDTKFNYSNKKSTEIMSIGQKVRYKLDRPINPATNKPLIGKFRETDIRFSKEIYKIIDIILQPNQPVMYQIDNDRPRTLYTYFQLQKVD